MKGMWIGVFWVRRWSEILRPTAVVACDEYVVNDLLRASHQMGLVIPDDLSLVAMQDYWAHTRIQDVAAPDPMLGVRVPEVATEYFAAVG